MDEPDWQPVKIAPIEQSFICAIDDTMRENCRRAAGKILYVRPKAGSCAICGGRWLEVRKDERYQALNLLGDSDRAPIICESQILAD
jgi:hypothetical protein